MGLDPSISSTGVAFPDGSTYAVRPRAKDGDRRLAYLRDHVAVAVRTARPDLVVIEDIQGLMRGAANKVIPMVHCAVRLPLLDAGVPYVLVNPSVLKMFATGRGNADKAMMAKAALELSGQVFATDDECDAAWLRWAGLRMYGEGPEELLRLPVRSLAGLAWPRA